MEGHTTITSLYPDGEPKSPKGAKTTVVNQCGYYVRENIPISFKLWKKNKATDSDDDIIPDTEKEMLNDTSVFRRSMNNYLRIGS